MKISRVYDLFKGFYNFDIKDLEITQFSKIKSQRWKDYIQRHVSCFFSVEKGKSELIFLKITD